MSLKEKRVNMLVIQVVCDVMNFEINLSRFLYKTKKSRQNFKYLENEKSF